MKIKLVATAMLLCVFTYHLNAQTRKGHVVLTTDLLDYSLGYQRSISASANPSSGPSTNADTTHTKFNTLSASFNVYAGYFICDRVLLGIGMNTTLNANSYMLFPSTTYSTFFRYYFNKPDTAGFDCYLEGNTGFGYTSTTTSEEYSSNGPGNTETYSPYTNSSTEFYASLGLALSYHISKHWSIGAVAGITFTTMKTTYGAYSVGYDNYGTITTNNYLASTTNYVGNSEHFKLRLELCL